MKQYIFNLMTDKRNELIDIFPKLLLKVLSLIYEGIVRFLVLGYEYGVFPQKKLPKPVLCVGNITMGGSGKTPHVIKIVKYLQEKGFRPAVLTRGYMTKSGQQSDEVVELKEHLPGVPVLVGKDRFKAAKQGLRNFHINVFVMDDGYQHWILKRDCDILVVDGMNPFGNSSVLPRGILREPLAHLFRAKIFLISKSDQAKSIKAIEAKIYEHNKSPFIAHSRYKISSIVNIKTKEIVSLQSIDGEPSITMSGIGNPDYFLHMLADKGIAILKDFRFEDHYVYTENDIKMIEKYCLEHNIKHVFTTAKDVVKLNLIINKLRNINIYSINIDIDFSKHETEFFKRILSFCRT